MPCPMFVWSTYTKSCMIFLSPAEGPGREILQCPQYVCLSVTFSFRTNLKTHWCIFSNLWNYHKMYPFRLPRGAGGQIKNLKKCHLFKSLDDVFKKICLLIFEQLGRKKKIKPPYYFRHMEAWDKSCRIEMDSLTTS